LQKDKGHVPSVNVSNSRERQSDGFIPVNSSDNVWRKGLQLGDLARVEWFDASVGKRACGLVASLTCLLRVGASAWAFWARKAGTSFWLKKSF